MRREIKLIIWVFVLVVGPALALSFLAARVLESWQIVLQKRMAGEAGQVLDDAARAWEHELDTLRLVPDSPASQANPASKWLAHAAGVSLRYPWVEGVYVFRPGAGLLYPPVESVVTRFESKAPNNEIESLMKEGGAHLERGETNAAIRCFESVDRGFDSGDAVFRDPEEGFFYDLVALRKRAELHEGAGQTARAAVLRAHVLERVLSRYDELVPLQRESFVAWLEAEMQVEGRSQSMWSSGLRAQWRERMRARELGQGERASLVSGFQMLESSLPDEGWIKARLNQADHIVTKIPVALPPRPLGERAGVRADAAEPRVGFLALKFNASVLITHLNTLFAGTARNAEIRVRCQTGSAESGGPILASRQLPPPFEAMAVVAAPENVQAFLANARLQAWLYRGGGVLLLMSVVAGVWLVWREAAREIRQARERSDFAATVSHDLRTPLSSMRMLAESLYMGNVTDEGKQKKFLGAIIKESDRLSRLTDRALYFIRYGQGALRYQFTEGDLGGVVKEVVDTFAVGAGGHVVIGVQIAPDLPPVRFDAGAMEQVVYNLLDNAVKYSRHDETVPIQVELVAREGQVVLSVQDHGVGMSPDEVRRILKPYVRGRNAGKQNARGLGLGLALCQHVVHAHGGRIQIQSELGKGSKFCTLLPV